MGGLVGDDVPQALRRGDGGGGQVDGGPEQSEQAGGGQTGLHQIDGILAAFNRVKSSCFAQLSPEAEVARQEPAGHDGDAGVPDAPEQLSGGEPARVDGGGLSALIHHHDPCGSGGHRIAGLEIGISPAFLGQVYLSGGQDVDRPLLQMVGDGFHCRLRRRQYIEIQRGQAHRHQQPHQHQRPQGVLQTAGDGLPEYLTQNQQGQDQDRGGQQDILHVPSPPAFSRMADSSAISASVSRRLSTMALIISPRLPP